MAISVTCQCGKQFQAKDEHAGRRTKCLSCGRELAIPGARRPAYDVFISYSAADKTTGEAICAKLEASRIRCWIAPRDITPGKEWGEAIIDGIEQSRIMVLVFSSSSNKSPQVRREVERAVSKELILIPFRIEDVSISRTLEYFLSSSHWLDALTPPLEKHIQRLLETVKILLLRTLEEPPRPAVEKGSQPEVKPEEEDTRAPTPADQPRELCPDCGQRVKCDVVAGKRYCSCCGRLWAASEESPPPSAGEPASGAADRSPQLCSHCGQRATPEVVGAKRYCSNCGQLWTASGRPAPPPPGEPASAESVPDAESMAEAHSPPEAESMPDGESRSCGCCGYCGPPSLVAGTSYCSECGARL